jgi:hypothetical protein
MLAHAADNSFHAPQVRIPSAPPEVVSVTDGVAIAGLLAANLTSECHSDSDEMGRISAHILPEISGIYWAE